MIMIRRPGARRESLEPLGHLLTFNLGQQLHAHKLEELDSQGELPGHRAVLACVHLCSKRRFTGIKPGEC